MWVHNQIYIYSFKKREWWSYGDRCPRPPLWPQSHLFVLHAHHTKLHTLSISIKTHTTISHSFCCTQPPSLLFCLAQTDLNIIQWSTTLFGFRIKSYLKVSTKTHHQKVPPTTFYKSQKLMCPKSSS